MTSSHPVGSRAADAHDFAASSTGAQGSLPKIGIGITTYNRRASLANCVRSIQEFTRAPHVLFIADDGSTDQTPEALRSLEVPHLVAANRGIAWNKNRALFYLHSVQKCDVVILLEDDTFPTRSGWEDTWIEAAQIYGHMNVAPAHWPDEYVSGDGTIANPYVSRMMTGQCVSFSRLALDQVGFLDTRFRCYGFEHAEHSFRMIKAGFGGIEDDGGTRLYALLVDSDLLITGLDRPPDVAGIAANGPIYEALQKEPWYRPAWRTNEEQAFLRTEMASVTAPPGHPERSNGPDWAIRCCNGAVPLFDGVSGCIKGSDSAEGDAVGVRVRGRSVRLFAGRGRQRTWLTPIGTSRFLAVDQESAAASYDLVYPGGAGFGLRHRDKFLCCDQASGCEVGFTRQALSGWETFHFSGYLLPKTSG